MPSWNICIVFSNVSCSKQNPWYMQMTKCSEPTKSTLVKLYSWKCREISQTEMASCKNAITHRTDGFKPFVKMTTVVEGQQNISEGKSYNCLCNRAFGYIDSRIMTSCDWQVTLGNWWDSNIYLININSNLANWCVMTCNGVYTFKQLVITRSHLCLTSWSDTKCNVKYYFTQVICRHCMILYWSE